MEYATCGGYVLDELVGQGASGTVWRAHSDREPHRWVAVKRLRRGGDIEALRREAEILSGLAHRHLVGVLEVVDDEDGPAIVMQYASGGSLADVIRDRGGLTAGEVVAVGSAIADAVAAAHDHGLVHGDVKPANILFTSGGQPLLADFGSSGAGTDGYAAPEVVAGRPASPSSDIYSLGMVCRRALGGAEVPPALAAAITRATQPDPQARPAGARDLARALRTTIDPREIQWPRPAVGAGSPSDGDPDTRMFGPRPPRPRPEPARSGRARRFVLVVGVAAVIGAGAAAVRAATPKPDCPPAPSLPSMPAGATPLEADTDGDGCAEGGYWYEERRGNPSLVVVVEVTDGAPATVFGVGQSGDLPFFGDWDCDGDDTLALYRPTTGEIYRFDIWPESGALERAAETGHPRRASPEVVADGECDRLAF